MEALRLAEKALNNDRGFSAFVHMRAAGFDFKTLFCKYVPNGACGSWGFHIFFKRTYHYQSASLAQRPAGLMMFPLALLITVSVAYVTQPLVKYFLVFTQLGFTLAFRACDNFQITPLLDLCNSAAKYTYYCFMIH